MNVNNETVEMSITNVSIDKFDTNDHTDTSIRL